MKMSICYFVNRAVRVSPSKAPRIAAIIIQSVYNANLMGGGKIQINLHFFLFAIAKLFGKSFPDASFDRNFSVINR